MRVHSKKKKKKKKKKIYIYIYIVFFLNKCFQLFLGMSAGENKAPGHWEHAFVISGLLRDNKTHGTNLCFFGGFLSSNIGFGIIVGRRAASTIALKAYFSYITGPVDSILGRKHRDDL